MLLQYLPFAPSSCLLFIMGGFYTDEETIHCGFVFSISEFILNLVIKFMNEYAVVAVKVRYIFVKALLWFCVFGVFHGLKTPLLVTKGNVGTSYPIIICR
jgi:hypothetical protein